MTQSVITVNSLATATEALEVSSAGSYQFKVDVGSMVSGDQAVIRAYHKYGSSANPANYFASVRVNYDSDLNSTIADTLFTPIPWSVESGDFAGVELTVESGSMPQSFTVTRTCLSTNSYV